MPGPRHRPLGRPARARPDRGPRRRRHVLAVLHRRVVGRSRARRRPGPALEGPGHVGVPRLGARRRAGGRRRVVRCGGLWAPDVVRVGDEWRMYWSASTFGSRTSAIGLAVAPHPTGPWEDRGLVVTSRHDVDGPERDRRERRGRRRRTALDGLRLLLRRHPRARAGPRRPAWPSARRPASCSPDGRAASRGRSRARSSCPARTAATRWSCPTTRSSRRTTCASASPRS